MLAGDLGLLEELDFTQYKRRTLRTLMLHGVGGPFGAAARDHLAPP
jgi:hypothetical protein